MQTKQITTEHIEVGMTIKKYNMLLRITSIGQHNGHPKLNGVDMSTKREYSLFPYITQKLTVLKDKLVIFKQKSQVDIITDCSYSTAVETMQNELFADYKKHNWDTKDVFDFYAKLDYEIYDLLTENVETSVYFDNGL